MATQNQVDMLTKMCWERGLNPEPITTEQANGTLNNARVQVLFKTLKTKPVVSVKKDVGPVATDATFTKPKTNVIAAEGFYAKDGEYYKVMWNRDKTRRYARTLELIEVDDKVKPHWIYTDERCKGKVYELTETDKVTPAQVKAFGDLHHYCICCGRELTVPLSVERGVGPKCWENLGW